MRGERIQLVRFACQYVRLEQRKLAPATFGIRDNPVKATRFADQRRSEVRCRGKW